jgi:serine/threonine protein kinase
MYVILSGDWPWPTDHVQAILDCDYDFDSEIWDEISSDAKDLIGSLLLSDPAERLTADEALDHVWFTNQFPSRNKSSLMRNTIQAVGLDAAFNGASEIIGDDEE